MKKILANSINRSNTAVKVDLSALKDSGKSRDNLILVKNDIIEIPEDPEIMMDTFKPKGSNESIEYYLIKVEINGVAYDATMASFRRGKSATDADLDKIMSSEVNRTLLNLGDDEQRASYLLGKKLKVREILRVPNRFDETKKVIIPVFEEI